MEFLCHCGEDDSSDSSQNDWGAQQSSTAVPRYPLMTLHSAGVLLPGFLPCSGDKLTSRRLKQLKSPEGCRCLLSSLQNATWTAGYREPVPCQLPSFKTLHIEHFSHFHGLREACPSSSRIHTPLQLLINVSFRLG